jgi:hypothetical protein
MAAKTWDEAVQEVLREAGEALHYTEITERIIAKGLRGEEVGATPAQTVNATINYSLGRPNSPYVRVRMGEFALRSELSIESATAAKPDMEEEVATGALRAFGMYWRRELVIWTRGSRILGRQSGGSSDVDFGPQQGLYLLHDRDRVIYVGRADDTMFARLKAHTLDRLSGRWDRFSWFGLRAVKSDGTLSAVALDWKHGIVLETLEALLIESLEPPLNRRRGDNLSAAEYSQVEDPELETMRRQELAARILGQR